MPREGLLLKPVVKDARVFPTPPSSLEQCDLERLLRGLRIFVMILNVKVFEGRNFISCMFSSTFMGINEKIKEILEIKTDSN